MGLGAGDSRQEAIFPYARLACPCKILYKQPENDRDGGIYLCSRT